MTMKIPPRLLWAVETLDVQPDDRILEVGCGRGLAVERICEQLSSGKIIAIDRSAKAIEAAQVRNARWIASGRAGFQTAALADVSLPGERFNKIFAVNVNVFWLKPDRELAAIRRLLAPDGALYLFYEPPAVSKTAEVVDKVRANLESSGFVIDEVKRGVASVCVIASQEHA